MPARFRLPRHALLSSFLIFLIAAVLVPSDRVDALVWTNTHRECFPICPRRTLQAVSFKATPMALPAFAFSGFIHATFLCMSTWFHSKSMMLERRSPVTSAKVTIGLMLSEQHSINLFASSLVSQRIRLLTGFFVLITGALFSRRI